MEMKKFKTSRSLRSTALRCTAVAGAELLTLAEMAWVKVAYTEEQLKTRRWRGSSGSNEEEK